MTAALDPHPFPFFSATGGGTGGRLGAAGLAAGGATAGLAAGAGGRAVGWAAGAGGGWGAPPPERRTPYCAAWLSPAPAGDTVERPPLSQPCRGGARRAAG